jgi:non-ribosomal peptide synthetase-like protein
MSDNSILKGLDRPEFILHENLHTIFREAVLQFSDNIALTFQNISINYRELDAWSDQIAMNLIDKGIGPGDTVGVWLPRGLELHVAVLAIIKAGAAYIPMDAELPADRVETILQQIDAKACFAGTRLNYAGEQLSIESFAAKSIQLPIIPVVPSNIAYIIFTSGSTGTPKGIPISHQQICHLIRSEQSVLGIQPTDRVYQGFSISFDMWCEETWISYHAGASLFVADAISAKAIDEISSTLRKNKITILHCVPSLLAMMEEDIPSLRLINAGGEACNKQVVSKWAKPNCLFFNSYGPSETTVTSSMIALQDGDEISIGLPLPNYNYAILDESLQLVPFGKVGELVITGPGVGKGYIQLPALSATKFIKNTFLSQGLPGETIYRTGDQCSIQPDGKVAFFGRIDDQVKLRGYRIELGEIENKLAEINDVLAAAVAIRKDADEQDLLIAYLVLKEPSNYNESLILKELEASLPAYMVPNVIYPIEVLPRLSSGKVNRKALPTPAFLLEKKDAAPTKIDSNASIGDRMISILQNVFAGKKIDLSMDFFTDLSGHSLLAASFISKLRKEGGIADASLRDVYQHRPLSALSAFWSQQKETKQNTEIPFQQVSTWRYYACWFAQTIALCVIFGLFTAEVFIPYLAYYYFQTENDSHLYAAIGALCVFCIMPPILVLISIIGKWVLIGRMKEGDYPLWGSYYFRWWMVNALEALVPVQFLNGTPLYALYLRMRGVKVEADAQLGSFTIGAEDLVTIGSDVSISSGVVFSNATIEKGMLRLRSITIGNHAYIGSNAVLSGNSKIEDWGELKDLSYLGEGKVIGTAEVWGGSPGVLLETKQIADLPHPPIISKSTKIKYAWIFTILMFLFPLAILIPFLPVLYTLTELDNAANDYDFHYLIVSPLLALMYTIMYALFTIVVTRWLQRGIKPGKYPVYSLFYVRKWLADQFMALSLMVMHPVYATVYISSFFRALGAKVGADTEISTASNVTHPLLKIGKGSFIADAVTLGESDVRAQHLILEETVIGNKSFIGNSALIPQGYNLPDDMLIGVLSVPPTAKALATHREKDWFGSPSMGLPNRQDSGTFDESLTMKPSKIRYIARATVELIRIMIPETVLLCTSLLFIAYVHDVLIGDSWWQFLLLFPLYYIGFIGLPCFLITLLLKWIFVGKYKAEQMPMWTYRVWRSEAITAIYEALAIPLFLVYLKGTPWLPFFLRFLGVKIGKRAWINTTDITEFDMVNIGDDAALNNSCGPQTHLFEDRVMKVGKISIGDRTSIGSNCIILYNSEVGNDVSIEPLSLVMKGESLPNGTNWGGSPVKKCS